jgi:hypothetical protein
MNRNALKFNNKSIKKEKNAIYYRCKNISERSVKLALTSVESFDARVFGYMNGESLSTSNLSNGIILSSNNFLTEISDLSYVKQN